MAIKNQKGYNAVAHFLGQIDQFISHFFVLK